MADAPLWHAFLLPALLIAFAFVGSCLDAVLRQRAAGAPLSVSEPVREAVRALIAQRRTTVLADRLLWRTGIITLPVAAILAGLMLPLGQRALADPSVGLVWFNAMEIFSWAAVWLAGWGPNSAMALIGGYRFIAQGLAYELPHMFALTTAAIGAGSLRVGAVVEAQAQLWFVVWMPVAFLAYLISAVAMAFWGPYDAALGRDLAGGAALELSGVDRLVFLGGRWLLLVVAVAMAVPLFLGGSAGPLLPGWAWTMLKTLALLAVVVWVRHRFPTVRVEKFAEIAWVVLIPLGIVQALAVAILAG